MKNSYEEISKRLLEGKPAFLKPYVILKTICQFNVIYSLTKNDNGQLVTLKKYFTTEEEVRDFAIKNNFDIDDCISEKSIII